jgi:hypothetical protein
MFTSFEVRNSIFDPIFRFGKNFEILLKIMFINVKLKNNPIICWAIVRFFKINKVQATFRTFFLSIGEFKIM